MLSERLVVPSFHVDFGPSYDGVTVKVRDNNNNALPECIKQAINDCPLLIKDNFADIKGKRSFGTR